MNYKLHYDRLCARARGRTIEGYSECHHVLPRCMGGSDEPENIVSLTPEEHYVAHQLLVKMHPEHPGLSFAVQLMSGFGNSKQNRNNKLYGWIRRKNSSHVSKTVKDGYARKHGFLNYIDQCNIIWQYFKNGKTTNEIAEIFNIATANVQRSLNYHCDINNLKDQLAYIRKTRRSENSKNIRQNISPEKEERRIQACKSKDRSDYAKILSKSRRGSGNPMYGRRFKARQVTCPHCGKTGGISQMKRWHMENCKHRNLKCE